MNTYFDEPRLKMTTLERIAVRFIIYCFYAVFAAATVVFLMSNVKFLFWLGVFDVLFLLYRIFHFKRADAELFDLRNLSSEKKINIGKYFSPASISVLERALEKSSVSNADFFLNLIDFLAKIGDVEIGLERMNVPLAEFRKKIGDLIENSKENKFSSKPEIIAKIENLAKTSFEIALANNEKFVEPRNIFSALSSVNEEKVSQLFGVFSIAPKDVENALIFSRFKNKFRWLKRIPASLGGFVSNPYKIRHRFMNRAWTARPTPTLDRYGIDFTDLARAERVGFLVGHQNEYDRLADVLSRQSKPNALLVGEPSSGKETLIYHLAYELIKDKTQKSLFDKRLVSLSFGNLVSGAADAEVALRISKIIEEIILAGNIILYISDIHNLYKTFGQQSMSAADILIPAIIADAFPVVAATSPREYKEFIEPKSDFAGAFETIRVNEISEDEAVKLLTYDAIILENQTGVVVRFEAIKQAVFLARKYFRQKLLPSSAEDLLKEALADASQKGNKLLSANDVIAIAERKINVPIHKATKEEAEKLLNLESIIHQKLIDQEEAVKSVSRALREYRSGLSRKGGPIAVFLFVGPTGVGKTELSKILTKIQFGSENMMIRFDMSEYQDKQSIARFIGSSDGKIAGSLTEAAIQKPYSLILLDEFEKAHPDILNLFLQLFDEGRLTDNLARTIDFTNTIIIATSNAHSDFIKSRLEARAPFGTITEELKKKLTDYFKPELLNRFSEIIVFKALLISDIEAISKLQLADVAKTISEARGINLSFDEAVIKKVAELGFNPVFGARPLRGVISEKIRSVLAEKILRGEIEKGGNLRISLSEQGDFNFVSK
ncbi:ATP-dependent Clp protease ATP-binding subunit [Candidatus Wolfebacteria bacterium]|nr:ATP-dependent Clp protease ATP-binding subunit [Candidatus Wolfebacteria bacterium]